MEDVGVEVKMEATMVVEQVKTEEVKTEAALMGVTEVLCPLSRLHELRSLCIEDNK
jgi:hypothetical protein